MRVALAPDAVRHPESPGVLLGLRRVRPWLTLVVLLAASEVRAGQTCPSLFADSAPPILANPKLSAETASLCYDAFAVLHSGLSRTPVYAAEHLTRAGVAAARRVERTDAFHDEDRLAPDARARIEDYVHSENLKLVSIIANNFFSAAIALASIYAIFKLSSGV